MAATYSNGAVVDGLGGGICQISSTLYDAVVMANLNVTTRRNHQFVTSYVPAGKDATVVWGSQDFKFVNSRKNPIRITATVQGGVATVQIWGVKEEVEYETLVHSGYDAVIIAVGGKTRILNVPGIEKNSVIYASDYLNGSPIRQDYLHTALQWVSKGNISGYMSQHRYDDNITELKTYFNSVIDWVSSVFLDVASSMVGLDWGRLYETYHRNAYNPQEVSEKVQEYLADYFVKDKKGIYEYILGGCVETKLLNIRIFDEPTKKSVYAQQTSAVKGTDKSNCPLCALGSDNNHGRIWKLSEMDADHVSAWSNGGATDISNCQMLCKTHNRAKGNR